MVKKLLRSPKGEAKFPKFKKRNHNKSFYLIGTIKVEETKVFLPTFKWIDLKEKGYIPTDTKIKSATVSEKGGKWFVSVR